MEQVEGGDLVVNRGDESRPKDATDNKRELNAVEGYDAALKLAQVWTFQTWRPFYGLSSSPGQSRGTHETQRQTRTSSSFLRTKPYNLFLRVPPRSAIHNHLHAAPASWRRGYCTRNPIVPAIPAMFIGSSP